MPGAMSPGTIVALGPLRRIRARRAVNASVADAQQAAGQHVLSMCVVTTLSLSHSMKLRSLLDRTDASNVDAGHMAELENAAWKDDRRFRILSVDKGVLSFVDLFMHTPSKPSSSTGPPSEHIHEDVGKGISITGDNFCWSPDAAA